MKMELQEEYFTFPRIINDEKYYFQVLKQLNQVSKKYFSHILEITLFSNPKEKDNSNKSITFDNLVSSDDLLLVRVSSKLKDIYIFAMNIKPNLDDIREILTLEVQWNYLCEHFLLGNYQLNKYIATEKEENISITAEKIAKIHHNYLDTTQKVYFFISYQENNISEYMKQNLKESGFLIEADGKGRRKKYDKALRVSKTLNLNFSDINNEVNKLLNFCDNYRCIFEGWLFKS